VDTSALGPLHPPVRGAAASSPLRSLLARSPMKLGHNIGIYAEAVGLVDVTAGASVVTLA
jgi:hypothetical protein